LKQIGNSALICANKHCSNEMFNVFYQTFGSYGGDRQLYSLILGHTKIWGWSNQGARDRRGT